MKLKDKDYEQMSQVVTELITNDSVKTMHIKYIIMKIED